MVALKKFFIPTTRPAPEAPPAGRPAMRIVADDDVAGADDAPQTLGRIDRRVFPRKCLNIHVSGRRLDHSVGARRDPCLHLSLRDVSVGGLCATSQTPVQVGEHVAVFFPPEGFSPGWDAYGRVLRVEPEKLGYRIAVCFDRLPAA